MLKGYVVLALPWGTPRRVISRKTDLRPHVQRAALQPAQPKHSSMTS
ncbi:MAG: hypothetical protein JWO52_8111 [Gammaproteobacteria bacterium]|jgi:hypothetical protein|nr:hypothetical protein [Gammaproteobacteria bacterium]